MAILMLNKSEQRKLTLFVTCLGAAVGVWLLVALSKHYVYKVQTPVHYVNFPGNKSVHPLQSDSVNLQIQGTGWQLMFDRIRLRPGTIKVSLRRLDRQNFVTFTDQLTAINADFGSDQRIVSVNPDTLYFDFSPRAVKQVPVRVAYRFQFVKQFDISAPLKVRPAYVNVTGPKEELIHIREWVSDSLTGNRISSGVNRKVLLRQSDKPGIDVYPGVVDVRVPVEEFTEKIIEVPIKVLNNRSYQVKLLPEKVKVTFMTSLSDYQNVDKDDFTVSVDLADWIDKGFPQLPVILGKKPVFCRIVSIEPQNIDFIIRK
ncbi:YbbR-like domain-containing protein [Hufsiella ginkgonis]|uniref:YbbR-like domain-containing protein n=1 Tax=Hufsiella ginkgonis TaxID=2695274 RepID=A0A7K1XXZ6_9SPHI|nr:YbbR-like domain-containing protein [Hufsiella ginkgonis]MXV15871.1 YbbR-like domain-containing protein [Hufsiella ginkgonis]